MRCDAALEILLEADPGKLKAGEHGAADHVARCPECRRAVDHILTGERLLDGWLEAAPRPDTDAILAGAEAARGAGATAEGEATGAATSSTAEATAGREATEAEAVGPAPSRRAARAGAWIALAAAAVTAVFLVDEPGPGPGAPDEPPTLDGPGGPDRSPRVALGDGGSPARPATPEIEVPADRNAAILRTADPDITVIWFYGGNR